MAVAKDFVEEGHYDNMHRDHADNDNDGVQIDDDNDHVINSPNVVTGGISNTSTPFTAPLAPLVLSSTNHLITPNHMTIKKLSQDLSLRPRPLPRPRRPLSREAKMLLKQASRSLMKRCNSSVNVTRKSSRAAAIISDNFGMDQSAISKGDDDRERDQTRIDENSCCDAIVTDSDLDELSVIIDEHEDRSVLLEELQSLRGIIPTTSQVFGDIDSHPCIIRDALGYLQLLKREIKDLNESVTKSMMGSNTLDAKVDVHMYGHRLDIRVSCRKKAGLLADIINMLESLGLLFDEVNASCHDRLLLKASSAQQELHLMDTEAIRRAIWMTIQKN